MNARQTAEAAAEGSAVMAAAGPRAKNAALSAMAKSLEEKKEAVSAANEADIAEAKSGGLRRVLVDRLRFGPEKIQSRIRSLEKIAGLPDPVGETLESRRLPNGLAMERVRSPLGVILMIYEARPHVSVNAGAFCLKSGNAAILRGGAEAKRCNTLLGELWQEALEHAGLPREAVQTVSGSHEEIGQLLQMDDCIDLVIPRGGKALIDAVRKQSRIPVIKHYAGVCHVYVDEPENMEQAIRVILDSKCLMPEVCNALETVLVSEKTSARLPEIIQALQRAGVRVKGCEKTKAAAPDVEPATEEDWRAEYLDMIAAVRVVEDVGEAVAHINTYGSHHTDSIVTKNAAAADRFAREVDSGVVLVNASTMFCDGETLGMGAEIGISTDKLHARGPMGLKELTTYKTVIRGNGHIMGK